jgi:hypothetical protein
MGMTEPPKSSADLAAPRTRDELLATKLSIPRTRSDRLARARLFQPLDEGFARELLPAGLVVVADVQVHHWPGGQHANHRGGGRQGVQGRPK